MIAEREQGITPGLFVKTHERFDQLEKHIPAPALQRCKHVYIFRSPEDSLVSYYHLHDRDEKLKHHVRHGIDSFCRTRVRDWISMTSSYLRASRNGADVFFVSYEILLDRTAPALSGILDWVGVDYQDAMLQRAVLNMKFEYLRTEEARGRGKGGEFSGRGGPGGGVAEPKAATLAGIRKESAGVIEQANQLLSRQNETFGRRFRER